MRQQKLISYLTLICAVCSLVLSLMAFARTEDNATMVDLRAQNAQLQSQIDKLTTRLQASTEAPSYPASDGYCSLILGDFAVQGVQLVIDSVYVQAQLPQACGGTVSIRRAELVLSLGDKELYQQDVSLKSGESEGGYEATLEKVTLPLPELQEGQQLDLKLEIILSDGQSLRSESVGWYLEEEKLQLIAG